MIVRGIRIPCAFATILLVLSMGAAEDKDRARLHKEAVDAAQQGQTRQARDLFCELARRYPAERSAKQECDLWTSELDAEIKHSDANFAAAQSLLKQND